MFTKSTLVAFMALALAFAMTTAVFAGGKRPGTRYSRPIFGSSDSCCCVAAPTATAAAPSTYRSYSSDTFWRSVGTVAFQCHS